jgi:hypothetical protein
MVTSGTLAIRRQLVDFFAMAVISVSCGLCELGWLVRAVD